MVRPLSVLLLCGACATLPTPRATAPDGSALEVVGAPCSHGVPEAVCTRHHPELAVEYQRLGDWCAEHGLPESQCRLCHPDLAFEPLPALPPGADLRWLSRGGEDVPELERLAVPGKVTVFDFYADWCAPCQKVDRHLFELLQRRQDVAVRKLDVGSWDSALARTHLRGVAGLPYLRVYGRDGKPVGHVNGLDLGALDRAIAEGAGR